MNPNVIYMCLERKPMGAVILFFLIRVPATRPKQNILLSAESPDTGCFRSDKSMEPDSIGTKDIMAVVVSKDSLDWSGINAKISQNKTADYASRLRNALGSGAQTIQADVSSKGNIRFKGEPGNNQLVACIVEVNK